MKKFFYSIFWILGLLISTPNMLFAVLEGDDLKNAIIPNPSTVTVDSTTLDGEGFLDYVLDFTRDSIFGLMAVIAIGMFLFIGGRLIAARWNPEEFKKAMLSFVYAAIGIFVVAAAWAIVRLVAGIDI